ncbi:hypothetical protein KEM54_006380 [Ascosphaera aggregata]|nr:hypothetical protein KEM54_006380 [Ascosphaera aggregata]
MPLAWPKRPTLQTRTHSAPDGTSLRQRQPAAKPEECTAIPRTGEEGSQFPPAKVPELNVSLSKPSGWSRYPHVDIAVLGATGSGKSTFIQHTLDLKSTPTSQVSAKKMSLEGKIYLVRLHEIEISEGCIIWPQGLYGQPLPPMDGIITLFDSSDLSTVIRHSQIFSSLTKIGIPVVIAACKCDLPPSADPTMFEQTKQLLGCVKVHRTAMNDETSHKKCVSSILHQISNRPVARLIRNTPNGLLTSEISDWISRTADSCGSDDPFSTSNSQTRQHVRASSENPPPVSSYANERCYYALESEASNINPTKPLDQPRHSTSSHLMPPPTPSRSQFSIESRQSLSSQGSDGVTVASFTDTNVNIPGGTLEMGTGDGRSEAIPPLESDSQVSAASTGNADQGYTFEELFNRLASLPKSETDVRFSTVFFIVYRKFATPLRLLNAFIDHYHKLEQEKLLLRQYGLQLRLITMLTQLVREHPGDFADPKTRKKLIEFTDLIEAEYLFTYFAKEINNVLAKPAEDFDKGWAFTDEESSEESEEQTSPAEFIVQGKDDAASSAVGSNLTRVTSMSATDSLGLSSASTNVESSIFSRPELPCDASDTILVMEHAQQLARTMVFQPSITMRESWRIFDSIDVDDFAHQITRMDWIMYRAFRGREMFRHANTPMDKRDSEPGLEHINRMVDSFNGLALFVVSMILYPEKAKHRTRTIEKFSRIAIKLRELNNYNSCGAIIAGFERAPVHRLTETRVLASKAYKSVWTLMSTSRSYSTYRLAFQNTYAQKIAFLPTHLSDLFRADQGNPTFIGPNKDRINWKKFDMLGGMILDVQQSQEMPYNSFRRFSKGDPADDPANADMPKQEKKSHDIFYMDLKKSPVVKELILKSERYGQEEVQLLFPLMNCPTIAAVLTWFQDLISRSWQIEPPMGYEPHRRRFESLFGRRSRD